jgi:beta-lactamase regulating signal transducer with metallopeptidase domain/uncharacterized membrane protein YkoI
VLLTFLLNACWQIALVTLAAVLCARLLRGTSARHKHLLWVAALALALGLPTLTMTRLSGVSFFRGQWGMPNTVLPTNIGSPPAPQPISSDAAIAPPRSAVAIKPVIPLNRTFAAVLAALYLLFLGYRSLKLLRAWLKVRAIVRSAYSIELPECVQAIIEKCQTALGVTQVRVLCSPFVAVPITLGSRDPLVILPEPLVQEAETDVLTSAIGHELAHIRRRDYLLNLIYEFISLPFSFHPAAALVKRRIQETRELRCDELVTERLLDAEVYARALVQLASLALPLGRPTSTITVGINDADILEERVMSMLKRPKINTRRKNWLLVITALCFFVPCIAAAPFALRVNINSQAAAQEVKQEGVRGEAWIATRETGTVVAWLKAPGDAVERGEVIAKVETGTGLVEIVALVSGTVEKLLVPIGEKAALGAALATIREPGQAVSQKVLFAQPTEVMLVTPEKWLRTTGTTPLEATLVEDGHEKDAYVVSYNRLVTGLDPQHYEVLYSKVQEQAERERRGVEAVTVIADKMTLEGSVITYTLNKGRDPGGISWRWIEPEKEAKQQAELAKQAYLTMPQAIQIAMHEHFGKVLESRLVREHDQACYSITILTDDGVKTATVRVLLSAVDGRVFNTSKEER